MLCSTPIPHCEIAELFARKRVLSKGFSSIQKFHKIERMRRILPFLAESFVRANLANVQNQNLVTVEASRLNQFKTIKNVKLFLSVTPLFRMVAQRLADARQLFLLHSTFSTINSVGRPLKGIFQ